MLKNHANFLASCPQFTWRKRRQCLAIYFNGPFRWFLKQIKQPNKRALSSSAITNDPKNLPSFNFKVDVIDSLDSAIFRFKRFADSFQRNHCQCPSIKKPFCRTDRKGAVASLSSPKAHML